MPQFRCALLFPTRAAFPAPTDTSQGTLQPILTAAQVYEEKALTWHTKHSSVYSHAELKALSPHALDALPRYPLTRLSDVGKEK